jgi:PKD domain/Bacterial Ig-like domain (group 3)/Carboxypeptidase regulatory-like domain/Putative Ig domain
VRDRIVDAACPPAGRNPGGPRRASARTAAVFSACFATVVALALPAAANTAAAPSSPSASAASSRGVSRPDSTAPSPSRKASPLDSDSSVSGLSLDLSSTTAGVSGITYTLQFTTSDSGALQAGGGQLTLGGPAGTVFQPENISGVYGAYISDVYDETSGQDLGGTRGGSITDAGASVTWTLEQDIPAGHTVRLVLDDVTNPDVGTYQWDVSTSADPNVSQTPDFAVTLPQSVADAAVLSESTTAAGATGVEYAVQFTTSSTGALAAQGGQITLAAPPGSAFTPQNDSGVYGAVISDVYDVTADRDLGASRGGQISADGSTAVFTVEPTIPAGHTVRLTLDDLANPPAGSWQWQVSTSSDPVPAETGAYSVTAALQVTDPAIVSLSSTAAAVTGVTYDVEFGTSATGGLLANHGRITLAAPAGTVFTPQNDGGLYGAVIGDVVDETTGTDLGSFRGGQISSDGSSATWTVAQSVPAGDVIDLSVDAVTNPGPGTYTWSVSTSSDPAPVQSSAFSVVAPSSVQDVTIPYVSNYRAGVIGTTYEVDFTTSPTGALQAGSGQLTLAAPQGTQFADVNEDGVDGAYISGIYDITTGGYLGDLAGGVISADGSTATWTVQQSVPAGEELDLYIDEMTNPAAGTYTWSVSTSSDPAPAQSTPFTITPSLQSSVSQVAVGTTTSAAGAPSAYSVSFTLSATGDLGEGDEIAITLPAGTELGGGGQVYDDDADDGGPISGEAGCQAGGDDPDAAAQLLCPVYGGAAAGDTLTVDFQAVNPLAGSFTAEVTTSGDPVAAASSAYTITPPQGVSNVTTPKVTSSAGGATTTYSVSFTTSSTGALSEDSGSYVTVNLPAGTTFTAGTGLVTLGSSDEISDTCYSGTSSSMTCPIYDDVDAGKTLTVSFDAADPPPGTYSLGIFTSSDSVPVTSPTYVTGLAGTLTADPAGGIAPVETTFTLSVTDPDGTPVTYALAYGDGGAVTGVIDAPYAPVTFEHLYTGAGTHTATASLTDRGGQATKASATVTADGVNTPTANAGDAQTIVLGNPVTLDGSRSQPSGSISGYQWDLGDGSSASGAVVQHTYAQTGTYTATLTVTAGLAGASAHTTITVIPQPTQPGLTITVTGSSGPLAGASVAVIDGSGTRYAATTDAKGAGTVAGLPDGTYTAYVYAQGYLPASVSATQAKGTGTAAVTLQPGSISQTSVTSTPLTPDQVQAAGLNPNDPANQNVYQVSLDLNLQGTQDSDIQVSGDVTGCGFWDASVSGADQDDSSGGCGSLSFDTGGYQVYGQPETEQSQPVVAWMIIPDSAQWTKQFFNVSVLISNLTPGDSFTGGAVTLGTLPAGLSLAPVTPAQTTTKSIADIPAGGSQSAVWVLRGDAEGFYGVSASYQGTLNPGQFPLTIPITSAPSAIHVWGASAVHMTIDADSAATEGDPFLVRVGLTDVADVPVYNAQVQLSDAGRSGYIYQPGQQLTYQTDAIQPGETYWTDYYRLIPEATGTLDVSQSFTPTISGAGGLQTTVETHSASDAPDLTADDQGGSVELDWTAPSDGSITGYEIFSTPTPDTPFGSTPIGTAPVGATSAVVTGGAGYYALSAVTDHGLVMYNELAGTGDGSSQNQAPTFTADTPPAKATVGVPYSYGFVATGQPASITYGLVGAPDWLAINPGTGVVTGTPPTTATDFSYTVTASNGISPDATTAPFAVTVQAPPTFTAATPPIVATIGKAYTYTFAATGTPSAITYSLVGAPTWLTVDPVAGTVTGVPPAKTKSFSYAVKATNGVSPDATTAVFTVQAVVAPTAPTFTADSPPTSVVVGAKYSYKFVATGQPSTITYALVNAPSWLTISASSGSLSGTAPAGSAGFSYGVTASNGVDPAAVSPTFNVALTAAVTTTKLSPPSSLTYGGEHSGKFSVTVSATGATPTGIADVMDGPLVVCAATLSGGRGSCTPASQEELPAGHYEINAVYQPDSQSFTSSASAQALVTVAAATTKTSFDFSDHAVYGSEGSTVFTVSVTSTGLVPPGTVAVMSGSTALCTVTLANGAGTCALGATQLPVGRYTLTAVYTSSTGDLAGSTASSSSLTVGAAVSTTRLAFTSPLTYGAEDAGAFQVTVSAAGVTPTGTVAIEEGSTVLCTASLAAGVGSCALTASQLAVGTYSLKAVYTPTGGNVGGSSSVSLTLVITN